MRRAKFRTVSAAAIDGSLNPTLLGIRVARPKWWRHWKPILTNAVVDAWPTTKYKARPKDREDLHRALKIEAMRVVNGTGIRSFWVAVLIAAIEVIIRILIEIWWPEGASLTLIDELERNHDPSPTG